MNTTITQTVAYVAFEHWVHVESVVGSQKVLICTRECYIKA